MTLGEKIKAARLEMGLTQRQLCGDKVTRNMISLIESNSCRPSLETLEYIAQKMGKTVGYFFREELNSDQELMSSARQRFHDRELSACQLILQILEGNDDSQLWEWNTLWNRTQIELAKNALEEKRYPLAESCLEKAQRSPCYCAEDIERHRLLVLARIPGHRVIPQLPSLDEELIVRGSEILEGGNVPKAIQMLSMVENRDDPYRCFLLGRAYIAQKQPKAAFDFLRIAEEHYPEECYPLLEQCCRDLEDYKGAYEYACKQKKGK